MEFWYADCWTRGTASTLVVGGLGASFIVGSLRRSSTRAATSRACAMRSRRGGDRRSGAGSRRCVPIRGKLLGQPDGRRAGAGDVRGAVALDQSASSLEAFAPGAGRRACSPTSRSTRDGRCRSPRPSNALSSQPMPIPSTLSRSTRPSRRCRGSVTEQSARAASQRSSGDSSALSAGRARLFLAQVRRRHGLDRRGLGVDLYAGGTASPVADGHARGVSVLFALIMSWGMARDILTPVAFLRAAADRLGSGDLRPAPPFESEDELGELARSFDGMVDRAARDDRACGRARPTALETRASALGPVCRTLSAATVEQEQGTRARRARAWSRSTRRCRDRAVEPGAQREHRGVEQLDPRARRIGRRAQRDRRACSRRRWTRCRARSSRWCAR